MVTYVESRTKFGNKCTMRVEPIEHAQRVFPFAPERNPSDSWITLQLCVFIIAETWRRRFVRDIPVGSEKWKKRVRMGWINGAVLTSDEWISCAVDHAGGILASERRAAENLAAALATFHDPDRDYEAC